MGLDKQMIMIMMMAIRTAVFSHRPFVMMLWLHDVISQTNDSDESNKTSVISYSYFSHWNYILCVSTPEKDRPHMFCNCNDFWPNARKTTKTMKEDTKCNQTWKLAHVRGREKVTDWQAHSAGLSSQSDQMTSIRPSLFGCTFTKHASDSLFEDLQPHTVSKCQFDLQVWCTKGCSQRSRV